VGGRGNNSGERIVNKHDSNRGETTMLIAAMAGLVGVCTELNSGVALGGLIGTAALWRLFARCEIEQNRRLQYAVAKKRPACRDPIAMRRRCL
jgi:hypothetical protein